MSNESKVFHQRMRRRRGKASLQKCVECPKQARDWAYQHSTAEPLYDAAGQPYSLDMAHYAPMCRGCHKRLDYSRNPANKQARADQLRQAANHRRVHATGCNRNLANRNGIITCPCGARKG